MVGTIEDTQKYREIVQGLLTEYGQIPYAHDHLSDQTIFDREADRYLLLTVGWQGRKRINNVILHIEICDSQVWIQGNNTDQDIVMELVEKGIPEDNVFFPASPSVEASIDGVKNQSRTVSVHVVQKALSAPNDSAPASTSPMPESLLLSSVPYKSEA